MQVESPKAKGAITRVLKRYKLVDIDKVNRPYLMLDTAAVQRVVNEHGKDAEEIVGGIEYVEKVSIGSR